MMNPSSVTVVCLKQCANVTIRDKLTKKIMKIPLENLPQTRFRAIFKCISGAKSVVPVTCTLLESEKVGKCGGIGGNAETP